MITYVVGDLFTSPAKVLVNTVNTVGVMGKGIAYDFKRIYPEMFEEYQKLCKQKKFNVGQLWLYKTPHKWILNFPTKKHWRGKSKMEYIEAGLRKFADTYDSKGMLSVSFPMLGCGNGGLDWKNQVQPLMEKYLADLPIDIFIHLHRQNAPKRDFEEIKKRLQGELQYLPFAEFWDDVKKLISSEQEFVTLDNSTRFTVSAVPEPESLSKQESMPKQMSLPGITASPRPNGYSESCLIFKSDSSEFTISKEIIEELWGVMKSQGYLLTRDFPEDMADCDIIVSLLQNLPYIQPIPLSNQPEVTSQDIGGLQFIAQVSERKPETQGMF